LLAQRQKIIGFGNWEADYKANGFSSKIVQACLKAHANRDEILKRLGIWECDESSDTLDSSDSSRLVQTRLVQTRLREKDIAVTGANARRQKPFLTGRN
jgi:hypothetical protein